MSQDTQDLPAVIAAAIPCIHIADENARQELAHNIAKAINRASDGVGEIARQDWPEGVTGATLNFDDGLLTIRPDGTAQLVFGEEVLEWEQEETHDFRTTKIAASEVEAIFEHIAKWTTLSTNETAKLREALESGAEALQKAAKVFNGYARLHSDKQTKEGDQKAAVNLGYAMEFGEVGYALRKALAGDAS